MKNLVFIVKKLFYKILNERKNAVREIDIYFEPNDI